MTDSDDQSPWAPRPEGETPSPPEASPATPIDDPWAPPVQEPPPVVAARPRPPQADAASAAPTGSPAGEFPGEVPPPVESVTVGPMGAETAPRRRRAGRGLALVAAAALIAGGGYAALDAGSASGGADSPEAALELMFDALSAEDLVAAAELVEPAERETLVQAGFDLSEELVRLEVLAGDFDLEALAGIDVEFAGVDVRAEIPRSGIAHLYVEGGSATASVDVSEMPLGRLLLDRFPADWLDVTESDTATMTPTETPVVAIERDGRWYLSLWYTVAENARLAADADHPDRGRRPPRIGGESPEEAVGLLLEEALRLDIRRMIGMLDPEEAAALYDYAPLFLDAATATANETLQALRDDGWEWELESVTLDQVASTDDTATVAIEALDFAARTQEASLDVEFEANSVRIAYQGLDYWDEPEGFELVSDSECFTMTFTDFAGTQSEHVCVDDMLPPGLDASVLTPLTDLGSIGIVTHLVDDRWYISPIRTGTETYLTILRSMSPEDLAQMVDGLVAFTESIQGGELFLPGLATPGLPGLATPAFGTIETTAVPPVAPEIALENEDLLDSGYAVLFAYDLESETAGLEIEWMVPELAELPVERGVSTTVATSSGNAALVVLEAVSAEDALLAMEVARSIDGVSDLLLAPDDGAMQVVQVPSEFNTNTMIGVVGTRVVIANSYGATESDMFALVLDHLA